MTVKSVSANAVTASAVTASAVTAKAVNDSGGGAPTDFIQRIIFDGAGVANWGADQSVNGYNVSLVGSASTYITDQVASPISGESITVNSSGVTGSYINTNLPITSFTSRTVVTFMRRNDELNPHYAWYMGLVAAGANPRGGVTFNITDVSFWFNPDGTSGNVTLTLTKPVLGTDYMLVWKYDAGNLYCRAKSASVDNSDSTTDARTTYGAQSTPPWFGGANLASNNIQTNITIHDYLVFDRALSVAEEDAIWTASGL